MSLQTKCLIDVQQLADCYQKKDVVIIDCRFSLADTAMGENAFHQGHIPSAHYFHLDRDMSSAISQHGGRHPLPDPQLFAERLRAIGVNHYSLVVCYDDQRFAFASRLWWLLRWLGHSNVRVLDGGYKAWQAAGLPTATLVDPVERGNFSPVVASMPVVDYRYVAHMQPSVNMPLIDSREALRYRGEQEPIDPLAGHIPGAINKPWQDVSTADGFALDEAAQRARWGELADQKELVVYCGSGVTASVNLLSLAMIGRDDAKLYAGSWSDWCSYIV